MSLSLHLLFTVCLHLKTLKYSLTIQFQAPSWNFTVFFRLSWVIFQGFGWPLSVDCLLSSLSALNLLQFVILVVLLLISGWFDPPGCLLSLWYWLDSSSQLSFILSHA